MATLEIQPGERILKRGSLGYLRARFYLIPGAGILTDRRIVHLGVGRPGHVARLLRSIQVDEATLSNLTLIGAKVDIDLPLDAIAALAQVSRGSYRGVLKVTATNGRTFWLLPGSRRQLTVVAWLQALVAALTADGTTKLLELEPGSWTVERS